MSSSGRARGRRSVNLVLSLVLTGPLQGPTVASSTGSRMSPLEAQRFRGTAAYTSFEKTEARQGPRGLRHPTSWVCGLRPRHPEVLAALPLGYPPSAAQGERRLWSRPPPMCSVAAPCSPSSFAPLPGYGAERL